MIVREAIGADVDAILEVRTAVRASYYPNDEHRITADAVYETAAMQYEEDKLLLSDALNDKKSNHVEVLDETDAIVGYSLSSKTLEAGSRIDYLHILSHFRRQGNGNRLASRALDWLGDSGPIGIDVVTYNEDGLQFWRKLGFVVVGNAEPDILANGLLVPHIEMVRPPGKHTSL